MIWGSDLKLRVTRFLKRVCETHWGTTQLWQGRPQNRGFQAPSCRELEAIPQRWVQSTSGGQEERWGGRTLCHVKEWKFILGLWIILSQGVTYTYFVWKGYFGGYVQNGLEISTAHIKEKSKAPSRIILVRNSKGLNQVWIRRNGAKKMEQRYLGDKETRVDFFLLEMKVSVWSDEFSFGHSDFEFPVSYSDGIVQVAIGQKGLKCSKEFLARDTNFRYINT